MPRKYKVTAFFVSLSAIAVFLLFIAPVICAQPLPPGARPEMQEKKLDEQVTRKPPPKRGKEEPQIVEAEREKIPEEILKKKIRISRIETDGNTLIPNDELRKLITPYEKPETTLAELQKLADEITALY
ncbi:MAG: POTRA domain-containing protein, partial [Candidatus Omnitrophica bacterium]|nr:POTRA domain-containing protein [Candidatus Omnitrophota bacterium]